MPDWEKAPPPEWERRLREVSPVTDTLAHLRFRWRAAPSPEAVRHGARQWMIPGQGQWEIYSCTPRHMATPDRAAQFKVYWKDLPTEGQRQARQTFVTTYQYRMWHDHGVDAHRFWVLQGPWGGTPAAYSERERRLLDAEGMVSEPLPLGAMPACDFNEQSVAGILERDRLLQFGKDADALQKANTLEGQARITDEAERAFRDRYLDWWYARTAAQAEFLTSYLVTQEAKDTLRPTTPEEMDAMAQWKDVYRDTGVMIGARPASSKIVQMAVL